MESDDESYTVEGLVPAIDSETFDSSSAIRTRVQRPTIAAAMKRVLEAAEMLPNTDLQGSQHAYEKTFQELKAINTDDDDEGTLSVTDWIVERIREDETRPESRAVRRQAATFCRRTATRFRTTSGSASRLPVSKRS